MCKVCQNGRKKHNITKNQSSFNKVNSAFDHTQVMLFKKIANVKTEVVTACIQNVGGFALIAKNGNTRN